MLIATTNEISGYEIDEVFGEVFGLTVRSRNMFSQVGAGLKLVVGDELRGKNEGAARQPPVGDGTATRVHKV